MNNISCDICGNEIEDADPEVTIIEVDSHDEDGSPCKEYIQVAVCDEEDEPIGKHYCKACLIVKLQEDAVPISWDQAFQSESGGTAVEGADDAEEVETEEVETEEVETEPADDEG